MDIFGIQLNAKHVMWSIIVLQCLCFLFLLLFVKREFHSDEIWTFGLANCKESPHIYMDINKNPINMREWKSAEIFKDYLTVGEDERFDFSIPYNNSLKDTPPLVLLYIHFISSIFPGKYSFAFFIPLVLFCIIVSGYCLYNLLIYGGLSEKIALLTLFFFGFSSGGIDIFIYLRHYSLLVTECLILLYLHMIIYKFNKLSVKTCVGIIICNILGVMTHHYYWIFAFLLGCYFVIYMIFKHKWRDFIIYSMSMLVGVGIGYAVYPSLFTSFEMWSDEVFEKGFAFSIQLIISLRIILMQLIGIGPSIYKKGIIQSIGIFIFYLCIVMLPLIILLAKNGKLMSIIKTIIEKINTYKNAFIKDIRKSLFLFGICLIEVTTAIVIVSKSINIYAMMVSANRYLFYIYPIAAIIIMILVHALFAVGIGEKRIKIVMIFLIVLGMGLSHIRMPSIYIGQELKNGTTVEEINNSNIIIVLNSDWYLTVITDLISYDNRIIALKSTELEEYKDIIEQVDKNKPTYLLLAHGAFNDKKTDDNEKSSSSVNIYDYASTKTKLPTYYEIKDFFTNLKFCNSYDEIGAEGMINFSYSLYKLAD